MTSRFDAAAIRSEFPVTKRMLYLDSAHQTPLATSVRSALTDFYSESHETAGPKPVWLRRVEQTRARVASLFNAKPSEVAFTKNTSEGMNIAAHAIPFAAGDNVVLIEGDHPNAAYAWLNQRRRGVEVRFAKLAAESEIASADTFRPLIDERTKVICLSHVSFHAGQRHDLASIGRLCRERGIYLVVDAMQSVGVLPVDVQALNISILAAGTHKGLLVPQGLGVLVVRDGLDELQPAYLAMSSLANPPADYIARPDDMATRKDAARFEIGNLNLPDIQALDAAVEMITKVGVENVERHVLALGDRLIEILDAQAIPLVGPRKREHRAHIYVLRVPVGPWAEHFANNQVRVSPERDGIRISFAMFNTLDDVERLAQVLRLYGAKNSAGQAVERID
ncbi:aminotransferase class V-fold PLP-dependent enzyme [Piscinibacter sp.]|uniref:aminotransferase class V-fold PLP-dependent enzyme n=1 Tax=Piscinibacter sp. TaxID=1903157 RepID=UPI0039E45D56